MSHEINIGILALQGDIEENIVATRDAMSSLSLNAYTTPVRYQKELESVDGLIIPGGESTVIGNLLTLKSGILTTLQKRLIQGMPAMGTCAGMIVMAKKAYDSVVGEMNQQLLGVLDIVVERNSFGRQNESFEANLPIDGLEGEDFRGVFIRAPSVTKVGTNVKILGRFAEKVVAV
ncbi:MAG: pyridoxal 5'-phosphate synthase glutaminase subunit PdxT, partial [Nitrososphaeraceae archaeon]